MKRETLDTEAGVQAAVRKALHRERWVTQKIPGMALLSGFPDLFCVRHVGEDSRVVFIEMKAPGVKKLRWSQVKWFETYAGPRDFYVLNDVSKLWTTLDGPSNWRAWVPKGKRLAEVVEDWAGES